MKLPDAAFPHPHLFAVRLELSCRGRSGRRQTYSMAGKEQLEVTGTLHFFFTGRIAELHTQVGERQVKF
jgi:hypothetical protein